MSAESRGVNVRGSARRVPGARALRLPAGRQRGAARSRDARGDAGSRAERPTRGARLDRAVHAPRRGARGPPRRDRGARRCLVRHALSLTASTTDGCNVVLAGLDLGPEDEIVTTTDEHFGLIGPLHTSGARVVVVEPDTERIVEAVTPRTRLVAVSHVLWTTGAILPVHELRARTGLPILVDGAQSVGVIDVDARGLDYYTVSGQKWLCGPEGTGALVVADPESLRVARPELPRAAGLRAGRELRTGEGRRGALRPEPHPEGCRGRPARGALARFRSGGTSAPRTWPSASGARSPRPAATSWCPTSARRSCRWRVPADESADIVARLAEAGRHRPRSSGTGSRPRIGRLVDERRRPRAALAGAVAVAACASTSTPRRRSRPISGAAVSHDDLVLEAADGNRFAAFLATPEETAGVGVVILPGRPWPLPLLRGARTAVRGARVPGARVRLLRAHGRHRQARRRLRVHAARPADDARGRPGRRRRVRRATCAHGRRVRSSPSASASVAATRGSHRRRGTGSPARSASTGDRGLAATARPGRSSAPAR